MEALVTTENSEKTNISNTELDCRKAIRQYELEQVIKLLPKSATVLEIGAGAGWQARELTARGFTVKAIDIPESNYSKIREWDVVSYDGQTIPFPDSSFDVVFSSNVLEHIPHVEEFQKEISRVLKNNGIAVHVMPSAVWITLTFLNFYPDRIKKFFKRIFGFKGSKGGSQIERVSSDKKSKTAFQKLCTMLIPPRHGETGSAITEIYLFSSYRWAKLFSTTGWKIKEICPAGLCYSGQKLFGSSFSLSTRESIAKLFGSSCVIYVLEKK